MPRDLIQILHYLDLTWICKLTKNADLDKYKYSDCSTGFVSRSELSFTDGSIGKNVIIFGADICSSVHIDNKNKDIYSLVKDQHKD